MRTLKLTLAYDGTEFDGWQVQRRGRTVQGTLEAALFQILRERVRVVGSGRTDAGVHALAQSAHVNVRSSMPAARLRLALNAVLPDSIVVTDVADAPASFHARYRAARKRYRYTIVNGPVRPLPFERRYVHHVPAPLNAALMRAEANALLGRHDVRAFHRVGRKISDPRRTINHVSVSKRGSRIVFEIEADGFLHTMVRGIVGTLLEVGRGGRPPGAIRNILRHKDRRLVGPTAPAKGLCLVKVMY